MAICELRLRGFKPAYYVRDLAISGLAAEALFAFDASGKLSTAGTSINLIDLLPSYVLVDYQPL